MTVATYRSVGERQARETEYVRHKVQTTTDEIMKRLAHLERSLLETKRERLFDPFRTGAEGTVLDRYYHTLRWLVDSGKIATRGKELNPTYHLTDAGWRDVGGKPIWL